MSKRWFLWRAVAALIFVGLLIAGGVAIYYLGWSQGYGTGPLPAEGETVAPLPYLPHRFGYVGHPVGFAPFLCGAGFFKIGLLILMFCIIGKIFRFFAWGMVGGPWMMGGPRSRRWARHWHRHHPHGPMSPWCWDDEKPSEETTEPDVETGDAEV